MHLSILKPLICRFLLVFLLMLGLFQPALSQTSSEPQREQLLNGLRLLLWPRPGGQELIIKLRIHSGAAFDLSGRSGQMTLLGDLLFPDRATIEYFTEEMNGRLDVNVNYDSITLTMQGKASELERILELLRNALVATQLSPEVVARMREARIKIIRDTTVSPATVADRAVASRLFGDYPYGRPPGGSVEDLTRVVRADLMQARARFLNSNNATLALIGDVTKPRAMRALRQLLGPWRKSEQIVPSTFRQPVPPDARVLVINTPTDVAELRLAVLGVSRSDPDYYSAKILAKLVQHRWEAQMPQLTKRPIFARSESHFLPGMFVMGASVDYQSLPDAINTARKVIHSITPTPVSPAEMDRARNEVISEVVAMSAKSEALGDPFLDLDTYRLTSVEDPIALLNNFTPADIQRLSTRLFKTAAMATIATGDAAQLKTALQGRTEYEILGEVAPPVKPANPSVKP
ncbi:MAG TPA: insulinase family protein [Pyrinomonadaceae bacterium]